MFAATKMEIPGVSKETFTKIDTAGRHAKGAAKVAKTAAGAAAAVSSATGLTVAATSGAGIASGLAAAGGVVGGGMALGPGVLAAGPAYLASEGLNSVAFKDDPALHAGEREARKNARTATRTGAVAGVLGAGSATVAGGASGSAIMGTLAAIGGAVGGGALAGVAALAVAPVAVAGAAGYGVYKMTGGGKKRRSGVADPAAAIDGDTLALVVGDGEESYTAVGTAYWDGTVLGLLDDAGRPAFPIPPSTYRQIRRVPEAERSGFGGADHVLMVSFTDVSGERG